MAECFAEKSGGVGMNRSVGRGLSVKHLEQSQVLDATLYIYIYQPLPLYAKREGIAVNFYTWCVMLKEQCGRTKCSWASKGDIVDLRI